MEPAFLLPETLICQDGNGPVLDVQDSPARLISLTMGITRIMEQQSIDVAVHGSADGENWGDKPIASYPQKFYCGVYNLLVDIEPRPEVRYLRVSWKVNRWGRGDRTPVFSIYVVAEPAKALAAAV